jgi:hypothetical protein
MRNKVLFLAGLFVPGMSVSARLQAQAQPSSQAIPSSGILISGRLRLRSESWGWFDTPAAEPDYTFFASWLRVSLSQPRPKWEWQVEFAQPLEELSSEPPLGLPDGRAAEAGVWPTRTTSAWNTR